MAVPHPLGAAQMTVNMELSLNLSLRRPRSVAYHGLVGVALHLWRLDSFVQAAAVQYLGFSVGAGLRVLL